MVFFAKKNGKKNGLFHDSKGFGGQTKDPFMTKDGIRTFDLLPKKKKENKKPVF